MSQEPTEAPDIGGYPEMPYLSMTRPFDGSFVGALASQAVQYAEMTIGMGYAEDYPPDHDAHDPEYWITRGVMEQLRERDGWREYVDAHLHEVVTHYFGRPIPAEIALIDREERINLVIEHLEDEVTARALAKL